MTQPPINFCWPPNDMKCGIHVKSSSNVTVEKAVRVDVRARKRISHARDFASVKVTAKKMLNKGNFLLKYMYN